MHMGATRSSGALGYVVFVALVAMTTAAYLDKQLVRGSGRSSLVQNLAGQSEMLNDSPSLSRHARSDHFQKRQSFSVTQDLDALSEMLREAAMRRRLQNAINFFNALKKRDTESTYGHLLPQQLLQQQENNSRK